MTAAVRKYKAVRDVFGSGAGFAPRERRAFGQADFFDNSLSDADGDPVVIGVKPIRFSCSGLGRSERPFQFGVMTVGYYLHSHVAGETGLPTSRLLAELVDLAEAGCAEDVLEKWMRDNFC